MKHNLQKLCLILFLATAGSEFSVLTYSQAGGPGYIENLLELTACTLGTSSLTHGISGAGIGDLDGDGTPDFAIRSPFDQDAVDILFLTPQGGIRDSARFGKFGQGGFVGDIAPLECFGDELSRLGDFDGDGVVDILVGHHKDDDGQGNPGAAWIVLLNPDGTVKDQFKISAEVGGLTNLPRNGDQFGHGLACLGDVNKDGIIDIAVGSRVAGQTNGGGSEGIVYVLLMNSDGTVLSEALAGASGTALGEQLGLADTFGTSVAGIGDLNGDGTPDMVVGAPDGDFSGTGRIWVVFLSPTGNVIDFVDITEGTPGFGADLEIGGQFGWEVTSLGDLNGDGVTDVAVSAPNELTAGGGGPLMGDGAVYILFLDASGGVVDWTEFREGEGGFDASLIPMTGALGFTMDTIGDLYGDGSLVLSVSGTVTCPPISTVDDGMFFLTLDDGQRAVTYGYGNTVNPPGSLTVLSGKPSLGTTLQLGVDNPLGTQNPGGFPFLVLSLQPDANYPNGTSLTGFGMAGAGAAGELLLSLSPADLLLPALFGEPWAGTGQPASINVSVPQDNSLLGLNVYCQGVLPDPSSGAGGVRFGLTEGLQLRLGP